MSVPNPRILSVATALPPHKIGQAEVKEFARGMFGGAFRDLDRLMPVFDNVNVKNRHFCVPQEWFAEDHSFPEKNALYVENALDLSEKAARRALDKAGAYPEDVGALLFFSTTGISTPSLDSKLMFRLGLSERTARLPSFGLGCASGAAGIGWASSLAPAFWGKKALLVTVELSGFTFIRGDVSKENLISTSLFADGAAAVLLGEGEGPEVLGRAGITWPGTQDVMGWEVVEEGFKVLLSRSVPTIVEERLKPHLIESCREWGIGLEDVRHFLPHPGGAKVLDAFEEVLGLPPGGLSYSRGVLRDFGNMSSATVLFILERFLENGGYESGDLGVLSAMGPGFSAEHVLFRC